MAIFHVLHRIRHECLLLSVLFRQTNLQPQLGLLADTLKNDIPARQDIVLRVLLTCIKALPMKTHIYACVNAICSSTLLRIICFLFRSFYRRTAKSQLPGSPSY